MGIQHASETPTSIAPEKRTYRSVSQLKQYERCPQSYKLARLDKVWQRPAAWLGQGSAVHEAAEAWEKSGRTLTLEQVQDVFRESYDRHINEACEKTPNFEWWFRSGPYGGEVDIERRFNIGLEQCEKFVDWHVSHADQVIWIAPDGTPGIELAFEMDLDGIPVRGFIDAVRIVDGVPRVVDYKTGNQPGDDFQLGVYSIALQEQYGVQRPTQGEYWMAKSGKPTYPYDLTEWTREAVADKFRELEDNIQAGRFDPKPDPKVCAFCDVALSCDFSAA